MAELRVLDLFSGIGGFSLGLERAGGFQTAAFCEIDPECNRILSKNWPDVRNLQDVCSLGTESLADCGRVDALTFGFPCQDISLAGSGAGLSGSRSGLFWEAIRALRLVRPRYVVARVFGFFAERIARRTEVRDCPQGCMLSARIHDGRRYCLYCQQWVTP